MAKQKTEEIPPPGDPRRRSMLLSLVHEAQDLTENINAKISEIQTLLTEDEDDDSGDDDAEGE